MGKEVVLQYDRWTAVGTERKAEMPLAAWFLEQFDHDVIEIGEVCPCEIGDVKHTVYDYGPAKETTIRMDASDVDYTGKNVLSISTIEHVGNGDYGYAREDKKAINLLKKMIDQSNNYLITFPIGYNREFEKDITDSAIQYIIIERDGNSNWTQVDNKDFSCYNYNSPYSAGNAICVFTNMDKVFSFKV